VWFEDSLWDVERVISPNKHQDYLLLGQDSENTGYDDGTLERILILIDARDVEFYPNTSKIKRIMQERAQLAKARSKALLHDDGSLSQEWLGMFPED
jgi:hypothetical protein